MQVLLSPRRSAPPSAQPLAGSTSSIPPSPARLPRCFASFIQSPISSAPLSAQLHFCRRRGAGAKCQDHPSTLVSTMNYNASYSHGASPPLSYHFLPRQRLNTLLLVHSVASFVIGGVGLLRPGTAMLFFSMESEREIGVGRILTRLLCSLIFAQGIMIWRARKINDGEIKRAFILAYFVCFLFSTISLLMEHMGNQGIVDGKFFGVMKIFTFLGLTIGYGWFTFFQPPLV